MSEPIAKVVEQLVTRHGSAAHLARIIGGVTARAVLRHASGERAPSKALAVKYVELAAAPTTTAEPAPAVLEPGGVETFPRGTRGLAASPPPPAGPTREHLEALLANANRVLEETLNDPNAAHRDRSAAVMAVKNVLRDLARLRGELEITESMVLRSRAGRHVLDVVLLALKPHPDALAAVAKELERLAGGEA